MTSTSMWRPGTEQLVRGLGSAEWQGEGSARSDFKHAVLELSAADSTVCSIESVFRVAWKLRCRMSLCVG